MSRDLPFRRDAVERGGALSDHGRCGRATARTAAASIAAALLGLGAPQVAAQPAPADGPTHMLIDYAAPPAKRVGLRSFLAHDEVRRLEDLKRSGALKSYRLLYRTFPQRDAWDAMLILDFPRYRDVERWRRIERTAPGGLSPAGLALASPVATYPADLLWHEQAPAAGAASEEPIYFVLEYKIKDPAKYPGYVETYILPQFKGWMAEGVLSEYSIYQSRYVIDGGWDSLIVLRYKDLAAFGRREQVVAKVRAGLKGDPAWQAIQEIKQTIRTESATAIADALTPP